MAACSIEVAIWEDVPELDATSAELLVATCHTGRCWVCHVDMQKQVEAAGGREEGIVPKRSYLNNMNPWHGFPGGQSGRDLRDLFASATPLEAMLVALEHMQVHFVLARRTRLPKFVKNVISFPQDFAGLASRVGLLQQYRADDRVNSVRGPGSDEARLPKWAKDASEADRVRLAKDERGYLVFPAKVKEVLPDGRLVLIYDFGLGEGVELPEQVWPRVTMPWHPRFLKGQTKILLRRNIGHGKTIEGLEVRWSKVNMRAMVLRSGKDLLVGKEEAVDETNASIMVTKKGREGQLGESSWAARRPLLSMPFFPPL